MSDGRDTRGRAPFPIAEAVSVPNPSIDAPESIEEPAPSGQLKMVTVVNASLPDLENSQVTRVPTSSQKKKDAYLGATIDGRYKVEAVLGEGGMGVVYRCSHTIIGKKVAMKVLRADLARDKEVTERFLNEAKSASAIGNPHIIDISDFGLLPDGSAYFVMEYLEGIPLTKIVEGGKPVPVPRIIEVARQLCEGLAAAHRAGIVHRDLKPDNIYLVERGQTKDFVKILDFGIAKVNTHTEGRLTRAGAVFGTPHYMSPEQAAGGSVDHRGDVYSFGVILYELASGKVPFDADNFMGILTQHMYKAPIAINALVPQPQDVPHGLDAIVLKCLSKRPEQRYASMDELGADVDRLKTGIIPSAVPEMMNRSGGFNVPVDYLRKGQTAGMPAPLPAAPFSGATHRTKWPVYAGIAGVVTAVLVVILIFAFGSSSTAQQEPAKSVQPPPPAPPPPPVVEKTTQVALAIDPLDAHVFDGQTDLGTSPVMIQLAKGDKKMVTIKREGFKDQELVVDGTESRTTVKLERIPGMKNVKPVPKAPLKKPTEKKPTEKKPTEKKPGGNMGGDVVINPWGDK